MIKWLWLTLLVLILAACGQDQVSDSQGKSELAPPSVSDTQTSKISPSQAKEELQKRFQPEMFLQSLPAELLRNAAADDSNASSKVVVGDAILVENALKVTENDLLQIRGALESSERKKLKEQSSGTFTLFTSLNDALDFQIEQHVASLKIGAGDVYVFPVYLDGSYIGRWETPVLTSSSTGYIALFVLPEENQLDFPAITKEEAEAKTSDQDGAAKLMVLPNRGIFWVSDSQVVDANTGQLYSVRNVEGKIVNLRTANLQTQVSLQTLEDTSVLLDLPIRLERVQ